MPLLNKRVVSVSPYSAAMDALNEKKCLPNLTNTAHGGDKFHYDPRKIIRPMIWTLRIFGILSHYRKDGKLSLWGKLTRTYSAIILVIFWLNFFRYFSAYQIGDTFGPALFSKIVGQGFFMLCIVNASCMFLACFRDNRLAEFTRRWTELMEANARRSGEVFHLSYLKKMSRRVWFIVIVSWIAVITNTVFSGYFLFYTIFMDVAIVPISPHHPYAIIPKVLYQILSCYLSAAWFFPPALFAVCCAVIYEEFRSLTNEFRHAVKTNKNILQEIEQFRRRHQKICRLVESADDTLRLFIACGISLNMFLGMLVLYIVVWYDLVRSDLLFVGINTFWIVSVLTYFAVIAFGGGMVNHGAHASSKDIYDVQLETTSVDSALQVSLFLSKLTREPIGLTAMDMFVIDKPSILAITGAFLTYFVVLVQFHQPSTIATVCNCSSLLVN